MITAIGISVIDHIMVIDGFKVDEGSFHCEQYLIEGGGMAATALCTASKLGAHTRLFSRTGDDVNAQLIIEGLKKFGVDTAGIVKATDKHSTICIVLVDSRTGEKQFYSERIKSAYTGKITLDSTLLEGTRVLLLDGHWIDEALKAARWARKNNIPVVADFKRNYDDLDKLFPYIDYFIIPHFFACELAGKCNTDVLLRKLASLQPGIPVITMGSEGGVYLADGEIRRYKAFPVNCVDSTGAGDAFHGAFCYFLPHGLDIGRCLELSSATGALNCRALGGRAALPTRSELSAFLSANGSHSQFP